jgi:hypothetical protein
MKKKRIDRKKNGKSPLMIEWKVEFGPIFTNYK